MCFGLFAGCKPEQPRVAGFHTLETAYDNGWISKTDLKSIAYYYHEKHGYNTGRYEPALKIRLY
jgi:hypothetical protein